MFTMFFHWCQSLSTKVEIFWLVIAPVMAIIGITIWFGAKGLNWAQVKNSSAKNQRIGLLVLGALALMITYFLIISWLQVNPEDMKKTQESAGGEMWRIGLTLVLGVIWGLLFYRVKSGKYIKSVKVEGLNFSKAFTFASLVVLMLSGLCSIWLTAWWPLSCVLLVVAWLLGGMVEVPLKERWLPTWFGKPTEISYRQPPRNLHFLSNGLNFLTVPVYCWGFALMRVPYAVSEIVNITTDIPTKESPRGPDNPSITGPVVKVKFRLIYRLNYAPGIFINLEDKEQVGVETIITDIAMGWIASVARLKTYQGMIDWRARINSKNPEVDEAGDKVPDLEDLGQSIMQRTGAELMDFQVMDVDSPIEAAQNELAAAEAKKRQQMVEAEAYAAALGVRTEAEVSAMKSKFMAEANVLMDTAKAAGQPMSLESAMQIVISRRQADATRSVIAPGVGLTMPINPSQA